MIKYFIMDVDGTLTDGKLYMGESGEICKAFNVKDGYAIHEMLIPQGIIPMIITGRESNIVAKRCEELEIFEVYQGIKDKKQFLQNYINAHRINRRDICYIGDDNNDLEIMTYIKSGGGIVGCPSDASENVRVVADYICRVAGGHGAIRELVEQIINK